MEEVVRRFKYNYGKKSQVELCLSFYESLCSKRKVGRKLHKSDKYNTVTETSLSTTLVYVVYFVAVKDVLLTDRHNFTL